MILKNNKIKLERAEPKPRPIECGWPEACIPGDPSQSVYLKYAGPPHSVSSINFSIKVLSLI